MQSCSYSFSSSSSIMDESIANFFNNILPIIPATPTSSQIPNRLTKNCELVQKFLGESQERKPVAIPENLRQNSRSRDISRDPSEVQEALAYAYYDKLWASSKHNQTLLLSQWNSLMERVQKQGPELNTFYLTNSHVSGMLYLCQLLNTNFVVRFRALELYNRYLIKFSKAHLEFLSSCQEDERDEFKARFESQIFLRMTTCILIASKLHSDTQVQALTTERIKNLLASEGFDYSRNNIARSEMRVMETLDYRCLWVTPLEIVEQLLSILNLQLEFLKRAHYFCILLLEYCYSDMDKIREKFSISIRKSQRYTVSNGSISLPLQCAAIVAAALFIVSAETKTELHKVVAKTANLHDEDVQILAVLLLDLLNVS